MRRASTWGSPDWFAPTLYSQLPDRKDRAIVRNTVLPEQVRRAGQAVHQGDHLNNLAAEFADSLHGFDD